MGHQASGIDNPEFGEIQALMCNEVLRDWLQDLEGESDGDSQGTAADQAPRRLESVS